MNIQETQEKIYKFKKERGFNTTDPVQEMFHMIEEVGELSKAIRKSQNMGLDYSKMKKENNLKQDVEEELADVLIFLFNIATIHGIDIEKAFNDKWEVNQKRTWTTYNPINDNQLKILFEKVK